MPNYEEYQGYLERYFQNISENIQSTIPGEKEELQRLMGLLLKQSFDLLALACKTSSKTLNKFLQRDTREKFLSPFDRVVFNIIDAKSFLAGLSAVDLKPLLLAELDRVQRSHNIQSVLTEQLTQSTLQSLSGSSSWLQNLSKPQTRDDQHCLIPPDPKPIKNRALSQLFEQYSKIKSAPFKFEDCDLKALKELVGSQASLKYVFHESAAQIFNPSPEKKAVHAKKRFFGRFFKPSSLCPPQREEPLPLDVLSSSPTNGKRSD